MLALFGTNRYRRSCKKRAKLFVVTCLRRQTMMASLVDESRPWLFGLWSGFDGHSVNQEPEPRTSGFVKKLALDP
jgi:hypothetical protein